MKVLRNVWEVFKPFRNCGAKSDYSSLEVYAYSALL